MDAFRSDKTKKYSKKEEVQLKPDELYAFKQRIHNYRYTKCITLSPII